MDNSKARAIATNNFQNLIFPAPIDFKLGLIDFKLQTSTLVQSICNKCGSFAIATNNFQKIPKLSDFTILNCKGANWDLVWMQEKNQNQLQFSCIFPLLP